MTLTIEDRSAIMVLSAAYAALLDAGRFEELSMLYMPEGVLFRADGTMVTGRAAILAAQSARPVNVETVHHVSLPFIDSVSEGQLTGRATFVAVAKDLHSSHSPAWTIGSFEDLYIQHGGDWLIGQRRVIVFDRLSPGKKEMSS